MRALWLSATCAMAIAFAGCTADASEPFTASLHNETASLPEMQADADIAPRFGFAWDERFPNVTRVTIAGSVDVGHRLEPVSATVYATWRDELSPGMTLVFPVGPGDLVKEFRIDWNITGTTPPDLPSKLLHVGTVVDLDGTPQGLERPSYYPRVTAIGEGTVEWLAPE